MDRRKFLQAVAAPGLASMLAAPQAAAAPEERLNFLVLMSDQHAAHVMGCEGDKVVRTPNLDRLASRGVLFENAYCQSPVCVPSRMAFLTAQQPYETEVWNNGDTLPSDVTTFAHAVGAAGYETALIGRMHFNGVDQWHGFEQRLVGALSPQYPHNNYPLPPRLLRGAQGSSREAVELAGPGKTAYQVYDHEVGDATVKFLRERAQDRERPFCAVAGFVLPHCPFICPREDWDYYIDKVTVPEAEPINHGGLHPAIKTWRENRNIVNLTDEEIRKARAGYYGLVTEYDRIVGKILTALEETGLDKNTVVIYTTDHGEMAGEHGMWWKMNFYEASVSVPLIVSCPSRFKPGRRVPEVVSMVDIGPTIAELAGAEPLPLASGKSLAPFLRDEPVEWANEAFSEYPPSLGVPPMRMIRSGRWKLIHYEGMRPQLFDLENDPNEFEDLGDSPAHAAVTERLHKRVTQGWSAERMVSQMEKRAKHRSLMSKWAHTVKPDSPQQWYAPADANQFPSEE